MKKKMVAMLMSGILAVTMLAGCGNRKGDEEKQEESSAVETSAAEESETQVISGDNDAVNAQAYGMDRKLLYSAVQESFQSLCRNL